eukprot:66134_1
MEARRKSKQTKPIKRKRVMRSELNASESPITPLDDEFETHETDDMDIQPMDTASPQAIKEKQFGKLLPDIRRPIKPMGEYLYGPNAIYAALKSNKRPFYHRLFLSPIIENDSKKDNKPISKRKQNYNDIMRLCEAQQIPIEYCSKQELNHFVSKNMHQGFVLDCDPIQFDNVSNHPLEYKPQSVWIAFDHLFNEENVGAVLRSSLFFAVNGCIYPSKSAPLSPLVATTSSGALDCVDIRICSMYLHQYLQEMKEKEWNIVGLDIDKDTNGTIGTELKEFKPPILSTKPMILVIGNESKGLSNEVRDECDQIVYIGGNPNALEYNVDSLNVASACSVALYHIMRNRIE